MKRIIITLLICMFVYTNAFSADLIGSGIDSGGGTYTLKDSYENSTWNRDLAKFDNRVYLATYFAAGSSYNIDRVALNLRAVVSPTGDLTAKIYSDSTGPGSQLGSDSSSMASSTLTASYVWYNFDFPSSIAVTNAVGYWIVIYKVGFDSTNFVEWAHYNDGGGLNTDRSSDGTTWLDESATTCNYRTYDED